MWILTDAGAGFHLENARVKAVFQTFDQWAQNGAGAKLPADQRQLGAAYAAYQREQRQYLQTLLAHGVEVEWVNFSGPLPADLNDWLAVRSRATLIENHYLAEQTIVGDPVGRCLITEQAAADLGTIAFTVEHRDLDDQVTQRINYYPLRASGHRSSGFCSSTETNSRQWPTQISFVTIHNYACWSRIRRSEK